MYALHVCGQLEAARKEIEDRLGPEKVAFLRKRAARKVHQNQPKGMGGLTPRRLNTPASQGTWSPPIQTPAEVLQSNGKC